MDAPEEFNAVCSRFTQDLGYLESTPDGIIKLALENVDRSIRQKAKAFLHERLEDNDVETLKHLWWKSPSHLIISDDSQFVAFLRLLEVQL